MKKTVRIISLILVLCLLSGVLTVIAACNKNKVDTGVYTYKTYSTALGNNWNPHTWETNADDSILEQTTIGLVDIIYWADGEWKWHYEMAESVSDITSSMSSTDLEKWDIKEGEEGHFWQIKLNKNAKWENGDAIKADDYVYSMQQLLNPELQNYRANTYYADDYEIVGARNYFFQGQEGWFGAHIAYDAYDDSLAEKVIFKLSPADKEGIDATSYLFDDLAGALDSYGIEIESNDDYYFYAVMLLELYDFEEDPSKSEEENGAAEMEAIEAAAEELMKLEGKTYKEILADEGMTAMFEALAEAYQLEEGEEVYFFVTQYTFPEVGFDTVGFYKVDDYTVVYITKTPNTEFNFLVSLTGASWLVHKATYEKALVTAAGVKTSKYGTSMDTYMSYGPYKLAAYQKDKQVVYIQNENWYGWEAERGEYGELVSYIDIKAGKTRQFQATGIVVDVMTDEAAKQAFLKGDLDDLGLTAEDASTYATSDRLVSVDETYTMRLFFNTSATEELDKGNANQNSKVLMNDDFRKAFSLAINRQEFCDTATPGYKPAFALLNTLYYYDIENDPQSIYRTSEWGMKAVVDMYGIEYGAGKPYATLKDAFNAATGYDLAKAKELMKKAHDALVADGTYVSGQPIKIQVAWAKAALSSDDQKQELLLNQYINAAAAGSGFGTITLEFIGNIEDRYSDVPAGKYAIGWGAWGGAAFFPFRTLQTYLDPSKYDLNEAGCFNPTTDTFTMEGFTYTNDAGETKTFATETLTWKAWCDAINIDGKYYGDVKLQLELLSRLEKAYLELYYCIPIAGTTSVSLLGYKLDYITDVYDIMYDFGGMRFIKFNYTQSEWTKWVKQNRVKKVLPY